MNEKFGSREVCKCAIKIALTEDRETENKLKIKYQDAGIKVAAVDFGGEFITSVNKIIERCVVASKREGIIEDTHAEEGAVAGAAKEAISQIVNKALGLNVGGKIGVARYGEHISVCVFFGIGLLHLNEMAIAIGHRAI